MSGLKIGSSVTGWFSRVLWPLQQIGTGSHGHGGAFPRSLVSSRDHSTFSHISF